PRDGPSRRTRRSSDLGHSLSSMSSQASPTSKVPAPQSPGQPTEASALRKIMWFGIVQIAGLVAVSIVAFYAFAAVFSSIASLGLDRQRTRLNSSPHLT